MNFRKLTLFGVALLFVASLSIAQVKDLGTFVGTVKDLEGTVLPGVTVTATNVDTGLKQSTITNDQGRYRLERIPIGTYNLSASLAGFKTMVKEGLVMQAGAELKVNFGLEIGKIEEQVTVVSVSPLVETTRSQVSTVITEKEILSYPQGNRNYLSLMAFAPGTLPGAGRSGYAINGMRGSANNFMIDGIDNNNNGVATDDVTMLPPEAIQEFRLIANNFSAEYGRNSGGVINAVMKSGTNEFHGSAWAFHRGGSSLFQTADWLTHDYPPLKRWQYGGTFGGPIMRDKLFFFVSFEGVWQDTTSQTPYYFFTPEAIGRAQGSAGQYFSQYSSTYPVPTYDFTDLDGDGTIDVGRYVWDGTNHFRGSTVGAKLDWLVSEKDRLALRWLYNSYDSYFDFANLPGFVKDNPYAYHTGGITWLHLFSPTMYNELRVGYHRDYADWPRVAPDIPTFGGYTTFEDGVHAVGDWPNMPQEFANNTYQLVDVLNFQKGNHSIKVGGELRYWNSDSMFDANVYGAYYFYSSLDWLYGYGGYSVYFGADPPDAPADNPYERGDVNGEWAKGNSSRKWVGLEGGLFAQDDWRVTDRLTISFGLRWEYFGVPQEKSGMGISMPAFGTEQGYLNTEAGNLDVTEGVYDYQGIRYIIFDGRELNSKGLWNPYYKAFAPKVSFAYDLSGDGKTSVRGGFGISYDRTFNNVYENDRFNYPGFTFVYCWDGPNGINPTIPFTVPVSQLSAFRVSLRWMFPELIPQKAYNWLFGIQRELGANTSIEINYTGSHGANLGSIQRPNRYTGDRLDGVADGINPHCSITGTNFRIQNLKSNYNAFQVVINKRFSQGWSLYTSYTYGNAYDQNSDYFGDLSAMEAVSNERIDMEYGYAQFDRRHRLVGGLVWEIPWGKKSGNWLIKNILAGWQFSGNFEYASGQPFTVRANSTGAGYDWNRDGDPYDRPLWTGENYQDIIVWNKGVPGLTKDYFANPTWPSAPNDLTYYNQNFLPRNAFRWFPTYNLNLAFQKYFSIPLGGGRDLTVQLIAEIFNVFKWMFWNLPETQLQSKDFGVATRMNGPGAAPFNIGRTAQFSIRLMF